METISLAIYWNGSQPFSQTGIREGSYWGRHDDHLNVVTLKWSEGKEASFLIPGSVSNEHACLSGAALLPAWLMSPCCDGPSEIWAVWWEMVSVWGPPAMQAQADDQCPLIYDIIHSIPSTVTLLMYPTHICTLQLSSSHDTQDHTT